MRKNLEGILAPSGNGIPSDYRGLSDLEIAKVWGASFHLFQVHFNKVVFYAASFRGAKDFLPVQRVLSDGHDIPGLCRPALYVH